MARTRFMTAEAGICTGSDHNRLLDTTVGGDEVDQSSTPATSMGDNTHRYTTPDGEIGSDAAPEDLGSGEWKAVLDVVEATSPMLYRVRFAVVDDSCITQGSQQPMDEGDFSGTGTKTATVTWDPPSGSRYQVRVQADGNGMHTDGEKLLGLRYSTLAVFTFPDAPSAPEAGAQPKLALMGAGF